MSLSEKMNLWDSKATADQESIAHSDTLFHGVEDDDETIDLAGLSGYSNVISGSRALARLVASLGQRSLLQWGSDGMGDLAVNKIRETILKSLPTGKISKREPPRQHQVSFRLKWGHIMNQPLQERMGRLNTMVITVCSGNAQVTSVDQYMHQTWPWSGDLALDLLRRTAGLKRGPRDASGASSSVGRLISPPYAGAWFRANFSCSELVSFLWDNMKITVRYDGDNLVLTTTSSTYAVAEFGEQLAWITAALWPRAWDSTTSSSPCIVQRDPQKVSGTPVSATVCFDVLVQQSPLAPEELWWTDTAGRHPVVVRGFPVPRQPQGYIGLEHSFAMLTAMGYHPTSLDSGKLRLTGPEKMLALVKRVNTVFIWGDVRCLSHRCYAVDDSERSADLEDAISRFDLSMGTHIVTPCGNIYKGGNRHGMRMLAGSGCGVAGPGMTPTDTSFESDLLSTSDLSDSLSSLDRKLPALPLLRDDIVRRLVLGFCHAHTAESATTAGGGRSHGDGPNESLSRPQRARHPYHPRGVYDPPTPEPENTRNSVRTSSCLPHFALPTNTICLPQPRVRTIPAKEVYGKDFVFPCPTVGPGYFVIRCDSSEVIHRFEAHPLEMNRAIRHFSQQSPKRKCHTDALFHMEKEAMIGKFGYRGEPGLWFLWSGTSLTPTAVPC